MTREQLDQRLFKILGSDDAVQEWWHSANKYWNNHTPYSIWIVRPKMVEDYIIKFLGK